MERWGIFLPYFLDWYIRVVLVETDRVQLVSYTLMSLNIQQKSAPKQSDEGLHCAPFCLHLLDTLL